MFGLFNGVECVGPTASPCYFGPSADFPTFGGIWVGTADVAAKTFDKAAILVGGDDGHSLTISVPQSATVAGFITFAFNGSFSAVPLQMERTTANVVKLAFFGATPVAQQAKPVVLADVIALLAAYGLCPP